MATYQAFRDRAEFAGQLSKSGGNSDLIDYLSKEVVTNIVPRERLLKGIADELPMKDDFEKIRDFLRNESDDMDAKGKLNEVGDQAVDGSTGSRGYQKQPRGRGHAAFQGHGRGRGNSYPQQRGGYRGGRQQVDAPAGGGRGRGIPTPSWLQGQGQQQESGRGRGAGRGLRGHDGRGGRGAGRGRGAPQGGTRVRRVAGDARPKHKVLYKVSEWRRDSVLEMVGLDHFDVRSQYEYHRRQGLDPQQPPL